MWRIANLRADNDATYPTLMMNLTADCVDLYNPATKQTISIDSGLSQSAAINGTSPSLGFKDQAALFTVGQTIWWYYVGGPTVSIKAITSIRTPAMGGPDLSSFTGYTSFAPAFPIILYEANNLNPVAPLSGSVFYKVRGNAISFITFPMLTNNTSYPAPIFFDLSPWIPPDALNSRFYIDAEIHSSASGAVIGGASANTPQGAFANISLYPSGPSVWYAQDVFCDVALPPDRKLTLTFLTSAGVIDQ